MGSQRQVFFNALEQKSSHCVLMDIQKGSQCTFQVKKAVESSFTSSVALLFSVPQMHRSFHSEMSCYT